MRNEKKQLQKEVVKIGGIFESTPNISPELENAFLYNILTFERANIKVRKMRDIFDKNFSFPEGNMLSRKALKKKIKAIYAQLEKHNIFVELQPGVPDRLLYAFLKEEIETSEFEEIPNSQLHINGCSGYCEKCFQKEYCTITD